MSILRSYEIRLIRKSNFGATETTAQVCGRHQDPAVTAAELYGKLDAIFTEQWFLGFHNHKEFCLSYLSLLVTRLAT